MMGRQRNERRLGLTAQPEDPTGYGRVVRDEAAGLGGCPTGQECRSSYGGKSIDFGVPNVGLCFSDGSTPPKDAGSDAPADAGQQGSGGQRFSPDSNTIPAVLRQLTTATCCPSRASR